MLDLSKIYEKDEEIFKVLQEVSISDAIECFKNNDLPETGQVVTTFITKINFLKTAIFDLCESQNIYATNIIFRSFLEHTLKFNYIFMKWVDEKNDSIGADYLKWYSAYEDFEYLKSMEVVNKITNNCHGENIEKLFYMSHPDLEKKTIKEIREIAYQFKYRNIIKYLNKVLPDGTNSVDDSFLLKIIPNYSRLSGYVHGGPTPDNEIFDQHIHEVNRVKELYEIADLSMQMAGSINSWFLLMLVNLDKSFAGLFLKLRKIL